MVPGQIHTLRFLLVLCVCVDDVGGALERVQIFILAERLRIVSGRESSFAPNIFANLVYT